MLLSQWDLLSLHILTLRRYNPYYKEGKENEIFKGV